jgi:octaprenyl-diphosphate synthase
LPARRRSAGCSGTTTREQQDALWEYGMNIGMAFQIAMTCSISRATRSCSVSRIGGDLREGQKVTLPVIHCCRRGEAARQRA